MKTLTKQKNQHPRTEHQTFRSMNTLTGTFPEVLITPNWHVSMSMYRTARSSMNIVSFVCVTM